MSLLEVKNLRTYFDTDEGTVKAVDDVSFSIEPGETLAIVGESGCGKSMTAHSILRLVPRPPGRIAGGEILWHRDGEAVDLVPLSQEAMQSIRGREIAMIFQEPMTSLNPVMRVGEQIVEALEAHHAASQDAMQQRVVELLTLVGIPDPAARTKDYPHQMSGGMRQRIMIAMALACRPRLLIADEPTTALDVTIQAQVLTLLASLQAKLGMALILITHDLGVVAEVASRVAVMYAGKIVELATVHELFAHPRHPYTQGLLQAIPPLEKQPAGTRLATIPGRVPNLAKLPVGCPFQDRCPKVEQQCREHMPELEEKAKGHEARCFLA